MKHAKQQKKPTWEMSVQQLLSPYAGDNFLKNTAIGKTKKPCGKLGVRGTTATVSTHQRLIIYKILVGKPGWNKPLGRPRYR
jgi:hypothetical protein